MDVKRLTSFRKYKNILSNYEQIGKTASGVRSGLGAEGA